MKLLTVLMSFTFIALSFADHRGGNGGDVRLIHVADVNFYIKKKLKKQLKEELKFISQLDLAQLKDDDFKSEFETLKKYTPLIIKDIDRYQYQIAEDKCIDNSGASKTAVFEPNGIKGVICFSAERILAQGGKRVKDIVALAYHEHLHRYNIEDKDHYHALFLRKHYGMVFKPMFDLNSLPEDQGLVIEFDILKENIINYITVMSYSAELMNSMRKEVEPGVQDSNFQEAQKQSSLIVGKGKGKVRYYFNAKEARTLESFRIREKNEVSWVKNQLVLPIEGKVRIRFFSTDGKLLYDRYLVMNSRIGDGSAIHNNTLKFIRK